MVTEARKKMILSCSGEIQQFLALRPDRISLSSPSSSTIVLPVAWMAGQVQAAVPSGFRTNILQSAKSRWCLVVKRIQEDKLLFILCVVFHKMGRKVMELSHEVSESSCLYCQLLRHAQADWNPGMEGFFFFTEAIAELASK